MGETEQSPDFKIGGRMRITGYRILHPYDPAHSARMVQLNNSASAFGANVEK